MISTVCSNLKKKGLTWCWIWSGSAYVRLSHVTRWLKPYFLSLPQSAEHSCCRHFACYYTFPDNASLQLHSVLYMLCRHQYPSLNCSLRISDKLFCTITQFSSISDKSNLSIRLPVPAVITGTPDLRVKHWNILKGCRILRTFTISY